MYPLQGVQYSSGKKKGARGHCNIFILMKPVLKVSNKLILPKEINESYKAT